VSAFTAELHAPAAALHAATTTATTLHASAAAPAALGERGRLRDYESDRKKSQSFQGVSHDEVLYCLSDRYNR
jgi:hypothetical protein